MTGQPPEYEGIIRQAKRPPGWEPPGPAPAGPGEREELWPRAGEDLCYLTGDWRIFQRLEGHRWSLDDLATAWWALEHAPEQPERALDLGCGIGSVLMMIAWAHPSIESVGIEAQQVSAEMARRSVAYNGAEARVQVRHGDLRDEALLPEAGQLDLVTGTPPYIPPGHGTPSEKVQCEPCRFELRGGIEAYCEAAARALRPGGRFAVCEGANPYERTFEAARRTGLRITDWCEVIPRQGKPALFGLFAMELAQGAQEEAPPEPSAPLVVRDLQGQRTDAYLAMRRRMGMPP